MQFIFYGSREVKMKIVVNFAGILICENKPGSFVGMKPECFALSAISICAVLNCFNPS